MKEEPGPMEHQGQRLVPTRASEAPQGRTTAAANSARAPGDALATVGEPLLTALKVGLVDNDPEFLLVVENAIRLLCRPWAIRTYAQAEDALRSLPKAPPDIVLWSLIMPRGDRVESARKLKRILPDLPVVICASQCDKREVLLLTMAGLSGYLLKPLAAHTLARAISEVLRGGTTFCRLAYDSLVSGMRTRFAETAVSARLSAREEEVMSRLFHQQPDKQIADELGVCVRTIRSHLTNMFRKLEVDNRFDAVTKYLGLD